MPMLRPAAIRDSPISRALVVTGFVVNAGVWRSHPPFMFVAN